MATKVMKAEQITKVLPLLINTLLWASFLTLIYKIVSLDIYNI